MDNSTFKTLEPYKYTQVLRKYNPIQISNILILARVFTRSLEKN
jgi:hypothetical protein